MFSICYFSDVRDSNTNRVNDQISARTLYAKGLPDDSTIESVKKIFEAHGKVDAVRLRRRKDKAFKGSVFVEYSTNEEAENAAKLQIQAPGKPEGEKLILMTKAAHAKEKMDAKSKTKTKKRKGRDAPAEAEAPELKDEDLGPITPDVIIHIQDVSATASREELTAFLTRLGAVVEYFEFQRGATEGYARVNTTESPKASVIVAKHAETKENVLGTVPKLTALTGDAEKTYWQKIFQGKKDKRGKKKTQGKKGNKKGDKIFKNQRKNRRLKDPGDKEDGAAANGAASASAAAPDAEGRKSKKVKL